MISRQHPSLAARATEAVSELLRQRNTASIKCSYPRLTTVYWSEKADLANYETAFAPRARETKPLTVVNSIQSGPQGFVCLAPLFRTCFGISLTGVYRLSASVVIYVGL